MRNKQEPNHRTKQVPPEVREATKHLPETQDPPSQDPRDRLSATKSDQRNRPCTLAQAVCEVIQSVHEKGQHVAYAHHDAVPLVSNCRHAIP